jgi:uncharacterized protein (DUF362 family)/ferredoxin
MHYITNNNSSIGLTNESVLLRRAQSFAKVLKGVTEILEHFAVVLPAYPGAKILLKPNCNANMIALTGNTTDLRLLAAVIIGLKQRGYGNITIGEGTNSGFYRNKIDIISLLRVRALAEHHQVEFRDLNYSAPHTVLFENDVPAEVAADCFEADCLINLPKLKTHFETGMSVCLKNLIGCMVGQANKKKVHLNLPLNILRLNQQLRPHLHIIDGLIAMEGLGPTRGVPVPMHLLIGGRDPMYLDYLCCRLAGFELERIRTLALARRMGLLTEETMAEVDGLDLSPWKRDFALPKANPLASFIHHPRFQKFFLAIRNTRFFTYLAGTEWFGRLLYTTQLRQDVFLSEAPACVPLRLDQALCDDCGLCADYCPQGLDPAVEMAMGRCLECLSCLYCFMVCPHKAIVHDGALGFMQENVRRYEQYTRRFIETKQ